MTNTEEGIPIRTIYVPELTINTTNRMLSAHFRQFGAIERVQILPERIHLNEAVNAANPVEFFNQQQNGPRSYFAYVTYVTMHGAQEALKSRTHTIHNHMTEVKPAFSWNQAHTDVHEYLSRVQQPCAIERKLFDGMVALNVDCILHLFKYLGVLEIIRLTRSNAIFRAYAMEHRHVRIEKSASDDRMSLMQLREFLRELHFGMNISSLSISLSIFSHEAQRYVCDRLYCYVGPQLRSLTMAHFNLCTEQFERMQALLINLEYFDADFSSGFDYRAFNIDWNRLHTLNIRTYGQLDRFLDVNERLPAFPLLTKLFLQCNFLSSHTLIDRLANACPNLIEFVAINVFDILTDFTRVLTINMNRLVEFGRMQKLVLSFSRRHFPINFMNIICQMRSLRHLMIDVVKSPHHNDQEMADVNRNLAILAANLPELRELQLCGVAVDSANLLRLIDVAVNLEAITILECPQFILVPNTIRSIFDRRRELFRNVGLPPRQLKLFVDESTHKSIISRLDENELANLVHLQVATYCDIYKNYVSLGTVSYMMNLRNRGAQLNEQQEDGGAMMMGRHDNFFRRRRRMGRPMPDDRAMFEMAMLQPIDPEGRPRVRILRRAPLENPPPINGNDNNDDTDTDTDTDNEG